MPVPVVRSGIAAEGKRAGPAKCSSTQSSATPSLSTAFANVASEVRRLNIESFHAKVFLCAVTGFLTFMGFSRLVMIPVLAQMLIYTLPIIWFGSHRSLDLRVGVLEGARDKAEGEVLSSTDAALFPLIASVAIIGLYLALKFLPSHLVNIVVSIYITVGGVYSVGETAAACLKLGFPPEIDAGPEYEFHFHRYLRRILGDKITIRVTKAVVIGYTTALVITFGWLTTKAWALHNLFAIGFCVQAIHLISVGSFKIASILLIGLFFYDIFWVFGTEVMVKVATGFEAPLKLLFPIKRSPVQYSLLGLGDIVIPGIFIAMTLRFDYWLQTKKVDNVTQAEMPMFRRFPKFYFKSSVIAYAVSISMTGCAMLFFKKAQPALLYLVPAMLLSLYVPALFRGELPDVIDFSEDTEEKDGEDSDKNSSHSDTSEDEIKKNR